MSNYIHLYVCRWNLCDGKMMSSETISHLNRARNVYVSQWLLLRPLGQVLTYLGTALAANVSAAVYYVICISLY